MEAKNRHVTNEDRVKGRNGKGRDTAANRPRKREAGKGTRKKGAKG